MLFGRTKITHFLAVYSLYFILFHIFWSIASFDAFRKKDWKVYGAVGVCHLIASYLSMLNMASCWAALFVLFAFLCLNGAACFYLVLRHSIVVRRQTQLIVEDDDNVALISR